MLKFDLKNKFKLENKSKGSKQNEDNLESSTNSENDREELLKNEMIASILKGRTTGDEDKTVTFADMNSTEQELKHKTKPEVETKVESIQKKAEFVISSAAQHSSKSISPESEKKEKPIPSTLLSVNSFVDLHQVRLDLLTKTIDHEPRQRGKAADAGFDVECAESDCGGERPWIQSAGQAKHAALHVPVQVSFQRVNAPLLCF